MAEVLKEVSKQVQPLHDWQLAFWSNGSGRPPGYFQMRVDADDKRYKRLEEETVAQSEVLKRLDTNMLDIASEKKAEVERKARRAARIAFWLPIVKWVAGGVLTAALALGGWAFSKVEPVIKILWEDYLEYHPAVKQKVKSLSVIAPDGTNAQNASQDQPVHSN